MFQFGCKTASSLSERAGAAVRIIRRADHKDPGMQGAYLAADREPIRAGLGERSRGARGCRGGKSVAGGDAYTLESEIECEDRVGLGALTHDRRRD